jgi:O-antigen/teichoic acid export membrane protein
MARLLSTDSFGEVQTLVSLFTQINIFLNVLGLLTVNIVVNNPPGEKRDRLILEIEKLALVAGLVLVVVSFLAGKSLEHFFHFSTYWPFVGLSGAVFVTVPLLFRSAYLRGQRAFGVVAVLNVAAAGADLVLSVALALFHWKTTGVMAGLLLAQLLTCIYAALLARRSGFKGSHAHTLLRLPDMRMITPELNYAMVVLASSLIITGMYSVDTIVVKHWFDAYTAGLYAGIATIARIIFFVTASIAQVLLPSVHMSQTGKHNRAILMKSFVLLMAIGGSVLLVFCLAPRTVVEVLMGGRFVPYANLLPRLSLVIFLVSVINLFMLYHLALRRYAIAVIAVVGAGATAVIMLLHHQTPQLVVDDLLYGCIITGGLLGGWALRTKKEAVLIPDRVDA